MPTIAFKPTADVNIYAAYKTAYKSGGFSNSGILSPSAGLADFEFEPEKAKGFELGIKSILADRQLRLNLGVYSYKYTNLQLDFFRSDIFAFPTINAGSARTKGVELVDYLFPTRPVPRSAGFRSASVFTLLMPMLLPLWSGFTKQGRPTCRSTSRSV